MVKEKRTFLATVQRRKWNWIEHIETETVINDDTGRGELKKWKNVEEE